MAFGQHGGQFAPVFDLNSFGLGWPGGLLQRIEGLLAQIRDRRVVLHRRERGGAVGRHRHRVAEWVGNGPDVIQGAHLVDRCLDGRRRGGVGSQSVGVVEHHHCSGARPVGEARLEQVHRGLRFHSGHLEVIHCGAPDGPVGQHHREGEQDPPSNHPAPSGGCEAAQPVQPVAVAGASGGSPLRVIRALVALVVSLGHGRPPFSKHAVTAILRGMQTHVKL